MTTTTSHPQKFSSPQAALTFILAGKAIISLRSLRTGQHYTFKIKHSPDGERYFVSLCTGDNEFGYSYLGMIVNHGSGLAYEHGRKSAISPEAKPALAASWAFHQLLASNLPPQMEVWHEGRCCVCARLLTDPQSIESGIGPECYERMTGTRRQSVKPKTPATTLTFEELFS